MRDTCPEREQCRGGIEHCNEWEKWCFVEFGDAGWGGLERERGYGLLVEVYI